MCRWLAYSGGPIYLEDVVFLPRHSLIDQSLSAVQTETTTDSETMFYLAETLGLQEEPIPALERMAGLVEKVGHENGIKNPIQRTLGLTDGRRLYAVRYSSEDRSRTLYHSPNLKALKEIFPDLRQYSDDARVVVSEPFGELSEYWEEIPESSVFIVDGPDVETVPFTPRT